MLLMDGDLGIDATEWSTGFGGVSHVGRPEKEPAFCSACRGGVFGKSDLAAAGAGDDRIRVKGEARPAGLEEGGLVVGVDEAVRRMMPSDPRIPPSVPACPSLQPPRQEMPE